jgi:FtsH-binding integral membrane protein
VASRCRHGALVAGCGAIGDTTRRAPSTVARWSLWALVGLIGFGIASIFVQDPNGALVHSVVGLLIFAGLTTFDFQRLRQDQQIETAPQLAAGIFLDVLDVFLFFLTIFGGESEWVRGTIERAQRPPNTRNRITARRVAGRRRRRRSRL